MRQIDLNELLEGAQRRVNFSDGSAERVWRKAMNMKKNTGRMLRWLIPAVAVCAALICLFAIPQARAGVFYALGGAIDQLTPDRTTKAPASSTLSVVDVQPGGEWIRNVKVNIENAVYDGQYLDLTITASGEGIENFNFEEAAARADPGWAKDILAREVSLGEIEVSAGGSTQTLTLGSAHVPVKTGEGEYEFHMRYDAEGCANLNGIAQAALALDCFNTQYDVNGDGYGDSAGTLELRFPVDLTAGNASTKRLSPQGDIHRLSGKILLTTDVNTQNGKANFFNVEKSLDGLSMQVAKVIRKPSETFIRIWFTKDKEDVGLMNNLLDSISVKAYAGQEMNVKIVRNDTGCLELMVQGVPESAKELTLRFYYRYLKEINGVALDADWIETIQNDKPSNYVYSDPLELPGGTFTVNLP